MKFPKCPDCGKFGGYHAGKDLIFCFRCWKWFDYELKVVRFVADFTPQEAAEFGASGMWKPDDGK